MVLVYVVLFIFLMIDAFDFLCCCSTTNRNSEGYRKTPFSELHESQR